MEGRAEYKKHEAYIEIEWKKIVQKASCVLAMEFFVNGVNEREIWKRHEETVRINKIDQFSLKVEVFFKISGTTGNCYGSRGSCYCFEATTDVNIPDEEGGNGGNDNSNGTSDAVTQTGQSAMITFINFPSTHTK